MNDSSISLDDPESLLPQACAVIDEGIATGLHFGAQVYLALRGQPIADFGRGENRPGAPLTADTVMLWFSAGKPIGAAAVLQLAERGLLTLDDPVMRFIPEFGQNGKEPITLANLLTHTGGFRWTEINWPQSLWDEIIARLCAARVEPRWVVGQKAGYHAFTSWYILAEVVRRVDGRPYSQYVRDEIFLPLDMRDSWIGMPAEQFRAYGDRVGLIWQMEKSPPEPHAYATQIGATRCVPGGNGYGPMHDLGRFYQMLLGRGELAGTRVLSAESARAMISPQRVGMFDETFKHVIDWGWGVILDSKQYGVETVPYGYGKHSGPRTFGHGGSQSSVGFADPDRELVAAVVFNGMPGDRRHDQRMRTLLDAMYEDLGLV